MNLSYRFEDHIPVWTAKASRRSETSDSINAGINIVDHDICGVINLDLSRQVLDAILASAQSEVY